MNADLSEARALIAQWQQRLSVEGLQHRAPPPEPSTCCARGCNGCVWEGYYTALGLWRADAQALLAASLSKPA